MLAGNGCGSIVSDTANAVITPDLLVTAEPTNVNECVGGTDQMSVTVSGGSGTIGYQWQESATGTPASFTDIIGATASTYTPSSAVAGTTYYRVVISAAGNGCGSIVSDTANAVITPDLLVTAEPTNVNECVGGTDQMSVTVTGGSGTIGYQWQESATGTPASFTDIVGATASTYTPSSAVAGTTYYRVVISAAGNGCGSIVSDTANAVITPDLLVTAEPTNVNECVGGTDQMSVTVTGGSGTIGYQWQESATGTPASFTDIIGATASTYTPSSAVAGTTYYRVVISAAGNGCGSIVSDTANAVITPDLLVTVEPTNVNECVGGTDQMSVTVTGGSGTIGYQWQESATGTPASFTDIIGATASTYTPSSAVAGTTYYRVVISAAGNGCGSIVSDTSNAVITPDLLVTAEPTNVNECVGGTDQMSVTVSGGSGTIGYQWQSSTTGTPASFTDIVGATASTYTPSSAVAGTTYYRVVISAAGSGCGSIVSDTANAVITPDLLVTVEPTNVNECVGGTDQMSVTVTGGSGTIGYQWQASTTGTPVSFTDIAGATASTYTPSSAVAGTTYYRVVISAAGSGCGSIVSDTANAVITPDLLVTAEPTNINECVGGTDQMSVTVSGGSGTIGYQWQ